MPAPAKDPDARRKFPTHSLHGSLLALVLALAIFRFFIQGTSSFLSHPSRAAGRGRAGSKRGGRRGEQHVG